MIPFKLKTIQDFHILSLKKDFMLIRKPIGLDIYITPFGKIFDFEGNPINNYYLIEKHFKEVIDTAKRTKMLLIGVLTFNEAKNKNNRYIFDVARSSFYPSYDVPKFVCYDAIFPLFNISYSYKERFDILSKVLKETKNVEQPLYSIIKERTMKRFEDVYKALLFLFDDYETDSILMFNLDKHYRFGVTFNKYESPLYSFESSQTFRAHIKNIIPISYVNSRNKNIMVADVLVVKFNKKLIQLPLNNVCRLMKQRIWENKEKLKKIPLTFKGFVIYPDSKTEIIGKKFNRFILTNDDFRKNETM